MFLESILTIEIVKFFFKNAFKVGLEVTDQMLLFP